MCCAWVHSVPRPAMGPQHEQVLAFGFSDQSVNHVCPTSDFITMKRKYIPYPSGTFVLIEIPGEICNLSCTVGQSFCGGYRRHEDIVKVEGEMYNVHIAKSRRKANSIATNLTNDCRSYGRLRCALNSCTCFWFEM